MLFFILTVVFLAWLIRIHLDQEKKRVHIPGPKGFPIVGTLFEMEKQVHLMGVKLHEKYGNLVYNRIFNSHTVLIGDAKLAKELFAYDQISGRPTFPFFLVYEGEVLGIGSTEGELWETHRRFAIRHLRDFGFGKNTMESLIMDEVHELVERIKSKNGTPVGQIKDMFTLAVLNSLWTLINGNRHRQDDSSIKAIAKNMADVFVEPAKSNGVIFFMPWLRFIMPKYTGYTGIRKSYEDLKAYILGAIKKHKRTFQSDSCRDFIDVYLKEMQSTTDPKSSFYGEFAEKQLVASVSDLFFAGTDTTSTTLAWGMLYLIRNPEVQTKLYAEISKVTGNTRDVSTSDRPNMPYLIATIDEMLRMSTIIPSGVYHVVTSDVTHKGVTYPAGTMMGCTMYYVHHNPKVWGDPKNFRPERFLSDDGKTYVKNENLIPFSVGKRHCLGESLARDSLFLFLGNIIQNFQILPNPNEPTPTLEPAPGFMLVPQEYKAIFKSRN